jgi:hypothetical protein
MNYNFAARTLEHLPKSFIKIQLLRSQIEAGGLRLPGISFLYKVHSLHKVSEMMTIAGFSR